MPDDIKRKTLLDFNSYRNSRVVIPDDEMMDAIYFFNADVKAIAEHYGISTSLVYKIIRQNIQLNDTYNFVKDETKDKMFETAKTALTDLMNDAEQPSARVQASKAVLNFYGRTHGYNKVESKVGDTSKPEMEIHEELYENGEE